MRRRELISLLGGAVASWPLAVSAQQPTMPVIGFLNGGSPNNFADRLTEFHKSLNEAGYVEGRNVAVEYLWAEGHYDRMQTLAADLVRRRVSVISAGGPPAAKAAKAATATIPIVFTVGDDPVKLGLVHSLNRPGGNATGVSLVVDEMQSKRLGLLHELVPTAAMIAVLLNSKSPSSETQSRDVQAAARAMGQRIYSLDATSESEIDTAFATLVQQRAGGLLLGADQLFQVHREQIIALASRHAIPTMYWDRDYPARGGLISYGINFMDVYRQAGAYVGRILKGEKPTDLPVIRPTKFQLVLNLKTAKALGLTIPPGVLAIADEVIE
jgi:putative tryptophan/tyrosine transport system substrate-binding protein